MHSIVTNPLVFLMQCAPEQFITMFRIIFTILKNRDIYFTAVNFNNKNDYNYKSVNYNAYSQKLKDIEK